MGIKKIFVVLISIFIIFFSSSCFAVTTLTDEQAEYVWEYLMGDDYNNYLMNSTYMNFQNNLNAYVYKPNSPNWQAFKSYFNTNNTLTIDPDTTFFAIRRSIPSSEYILWVFNFNNSKPNGNNYPFLNLTFEPNNRRMYINGVDDQKNPMLFQSHLFVFTFDGNSLNFTNNWVGNYNINDKVSFYYNWGNETWNGSNSNNTSVLDCLPRFVFFFKH